MAVVSLLPSIPQEINPVSYPGNMMSTVTITEESPPRPIQFVEEKMYFAAGKDTKECKLLLEWALRNRNGRKLCILHVHEPDQWIRTALGAMEHVSKAAARDVKEHREVERQKMNKLLRDYCITCSSAGVVEVVHIENNSIEKGIVELINQHGIRKLVMGAAADRHHSKKMVEPRSKKAIYVRQHAPMFCHIWFICKGQLVRTREGTSEGDNISPNFEIGQSIYGRSQSVPDLPVNQLNSTNLGPMGRASTFSIYDSRVVTPRSSSSSVNLLGTSRSSSSTSNRSCSSLHMPGVSAPVLTKADYDQFSSPPILSQERHINDKIYDQLEQFRAEAEASRREAFEESMRRRKAEKDAIDAFRRVGEVTKQLHFALESKSSIESQFAKYEQMVKDLEQKYKKERDELQKERDNALKEAEELRREKASTAANGLAPEIFSDVSFPEIREATSNFDESLKIGEGGYGILYKGFLRHTQVAIKTLKSDSMQGPLEFKQEVTVLSKLRHPNLVTLIGSCPEFFILVYEYLPNGSLEDRLCCKDNSPPLSWQTRIRIATELCSALIFLHSCKPYCIVHGDLKPANIPLDSNCVSKLSDFGICRILDQNQFSSDNTTPCWITECPKGTLTYMDPEFLATGKLTPKSDVYSFGIILLRLLTGRSALWIARDVKDAVDKGNLENLLDPTAGDWPFMQAQQLVRTALRCCEMNGQNRPDLALDVWRELKHTSVEAQ